MTAPSVIASVVVATRNRTDLLERALRSIARQTLAELEVIVVDDGSSADVLDHHDRLLRELGDRFHLVRPSVPGARGTGPAAARNRGAAVARGEFIAFIDDDDEWIWPDYLRTATASMRSNNADYLFGHLVGVRGGVTQDPGWTPPNDVFVKEEVITTLPTIYRLSQTAIAVVAQRFMIHPSNSVIRREVFVRAGGFFEGLWSHAEDLNLMLRVLDQTRRVLYLAETVTAYRLPEGDSISLTEVETLHFMQRILAAQSARLQSRTADLRKWARARESWTYREMTNHALRQGQPADAIVFACQAFVTCATAGTSAFVVGTLLKCLRPPAAEPSTKARVKAGSAS